MGATKTLLADFKGLVTAPGLLMRSEASCTDATNCLFDAPGVMRKRPGFSRLQYGFGGPIYQIHSSPLLSDYFLAHYGSVSSPGTIRIGNGISGASTVIPSIDGANISRPQDLRQRMALLGSSHYLTSDEGARRLESGLSTIRYAGMPRGLAPSTSNMNAAVFSVLQAANPWLVSGNSVAYRVTWHRLDDGGQELGGSPTARVTIRNIAGTSGFTGATRAVRLRIPIPYEYGTASIALTTSYFFRLWRSRDGITSEPDDEMALVAQLKLTAGDISAGYVQIDDVTPSSLLAAAPKLHTTPVGFPDGEANIRNGQLNADDAPPSANCVASWRECLWYADTQGKSATVIQLLSVGGAGLVAGQAVSFNGGVNEVVPQAARVNIDDFVIVTTLPTLALNIEATARNMVESWNEAWGSSSEVQAYYVSVGSQQPGIILIECKRQAGTTAAGACVANPAAFRFGPPNTRSGGTNVLQYSKPNRADACAVVNTLTAGSSQTQILQIVPYRDFLIVFTTTGIYAVTGSSWADFNIAPFDLTFRLLGRDLVAVADDRVYAWCVEGIVEIDEGGCRVISTPIEPTITALLGASPSSYANHSFAVAYRLQHRVTFFVSSSVGNASTGYVFDTRTRAWSTIVFSRGSGDIQDFQKSCGVVRFSDDRLVLGNYSFSGGDAYVFAERRAQDNTDYQDTNAANVTDPVTSSLTFQFMVPDSEGSAHWQQTVAHFDYGFAWRQSPTSFRIQYLTEWAFSGNITVSPVAIPYSTVGAYLSRVEPPATVRRANRLALRFSHITAEAFGLNGVSQSVRIGSKFSRRT